MTTITYQYATNGKTVVFYGFAYPTTRTRTTGRMCQAGPKSDRLALEVASVYTSMGHCCCRSICGLRKNQLGTDGDATVIGSVAFVFEEQIHFGEQEHYICWECLNLLGGCWTKLCQHCNYRLPNVGQVGSGKQWSNSNSVLNVLFLGMASVLQDVEREMGSWSVLSAFKLSI